jgi:hypothetical protein
MCGDFQMIRRDFPLDLGDLAWCAAAVAIVVLLLGVLGPALDEQHGSPALQDAQAAAVATFHRDMAAAKACRTNHPGSLVRWDSEGRLVCTPQTTGENHE